MTTTQSLRQIGAGLRAFLVLTLVLGVAYPLVMTGLAHVLFPARADGSLVRADGDVVGSELIGQEFSRPLLEEGEPVTDADGTPLTEPDPAYFQSRPSAAGYDPRASGASNLGPESPDLVTLVDQRRATSAALDGVRPEDVASDALLASGSGLDPHISPAYAAQQVARVTRQRGLSESQVSGLVEAHTEGRWLGFLGEPGVNVLILNLALDDLDRSGAADSE